MPLAKVPANASLYYEIELLRCQRGGDGDDSPKVCCDEAHFPCPTPHFADTEDLEDDDTRPLTA